MAECGCHPFMRRYLPTISMLSIRFASGLTIAPPGRRPQRGSRHNPLQSKWEVCLVSK
ncbi:hypothetical protein ARTHRO9AX_130055 [Arthrobacter sp. 9AX]|nr:hypothetical protein ARTHRO9AX_130055 [Arthrobacter sp. 9AX]